RPRFARTRDDGIVLRPDRAHVVIRREFLMRGRRSRRGDRRALFGRQGDRRPFAHPRFSALAAQPRPATRAKGRARLPWRDRAESSWWKNTPIAGAAKAAHGNSPRICLLFTTRSTPIAIAAVRLE